MRTEEGCSLCGVGPDDECSMECPSRMVPMDDAGAPGPLPLRSLLEDHDFEDMATASFIGTEEFDAAVAILNEELGPGYDRAQAYRLFLIVKVTAHLSGIRLDELEDHDPMADFFMRLQIMSAVVGQELRERLS